MKKILGGLIGLFITLAAVGVAFALAFNQVTISGLGMSIPDPDLQIAATTDGPFGTNYDLPLGVITDLRPGDPARQFPFALKNVSDKNMVLVPSIPTTGWDPDAAVAVFITIVPSTITEAQINELNLWNSVLGWGATCCYTLYGVLEANQTANYTLWIKVDPNPERISAGKTVSDIQILLTGNKEE
jgi:hypothetical protein